MVPMETVFRLAERLGSPPYPAPFENFFYFPPVPNQNKNIFTNIRRLSEKSLLASLESLKNDFRENEGFSEVGIGC